MRSFIGCLRPNELLAKSELWICFKVSHNKNILLSNFSPYYSSEVFSRSWSGPRVFLLFSWHTTTQRLQGTMTWYLIPSPQTAGLTFSLQHWNFSLLLSHSCPDRVNTDGALGLTETKHLDEKVNKCLVLNRKALNIASFSWNGESPGPACRTSDIGQGCETKNILT